jgi:hypothetical protein
LLVITPFAVNVSAVVVSRTTGAVSVWTVPVADRSRVTSRSVADVWVVGVAVAVSSRVIVICASAVVVAITPVAVIVTTLEVSRTIGAVSVSTVPVADRSRVTSRSVAGV